MKLADLEPVHFGLRKKPALGVAFNCPGECCAKQRDLQARAAGLEATGHRHARRARREAFKDQPFRFWIAFANSLGAQAKVGDRDPLSGPSGAVIEKLYTRSGKDWDDLTIAEDIDRTSVGHARIRITNGNVEVL